MPKVPAQHLEQRRRQILDAALGLFAQDGFHATSMHQIIEASGMSAGAVYHYFPTKRGLVEAAGLAVTDAFLAPMRTMPSRTQLPTPADVIELFCAHLAELHRQVPDLTRVGVFLWAEELREESIAASVAQTKQQVIAGFLPLIERWRQAGVVRPDCDPHSVALVLYGLLPGFVLQINTIGVLPAHAYAAAVVALASEVQIAPAPRLEPAPRTERPGAVSASAHPRWRPISPAGDSPS